MTAPVAKSEKAELGRGSPFRLGTPYGDLPLVFEPAESRRVEELAAWLRENRDWVEERLARHGAFLFRGFDVRRAEDFEKIALAIDEELQTEYLGTSPRQALTPRVFTASELPGYYPIPEHCEMSFLPKPPRRVFFSCLEEPEEGSGETPLCDFRKVWRDLDPAVRRRFEEGGIRIVRNYSGPRSKGFDFWKLKRWDEMFLTTDKSVVEAKCREHGFEVTWLPNDGLRLVHTQPVFRDHPRTGERVWHNHTQVFHLSAAPGEYARIFRLRPSARIFFLWQLSRVLVWAKRTFTSSEAQAMHCTYADGREIPDADMEHVRDVIWRHLVVFPWRRGDVLAIDNHSVAHGRLPYRGRRLVAVAWA
ncbi:MAG: taurine dioxygenase [Candidatus Binatia bacterium]|nr:MAG: taurine dioxygenase [Candidatus Binatia bacterium]